MRLRTCGIADDGQEDDTNELSTDVSALRHAVDGVNKPLGCECDKLADGIRTLIFSWEYITYHADHNQKNHSSLEAHCWDFSFFIRLFPFSLRLSSEDFSSLKVSWVS